MRRRRVAQQNEASQQAASCRRRSLRRRRQHQQRIRKVFACTTSAQPAGHDHHRILRNDLDLFSVYCCCCQCRRRSHNAFSCSVDLRSTAADRPLRHMHLKLKPERKLGSLGFSIEGQNLRYDPGVGTHSYVQLRLTALASKTTSLVRASELKHVVSTTYICISIGR